MYPAALCRCGESSQGAIFFEMKTLLRFISSFDLSDVAFCILSRYNRTLSHLSRQDPCSCRIHYFNRNVHGEQSSQHLRLTPLCSETILEQNRSVNELVIRNLEGQCHYQLMYLNCEAMMRMTTSVIDITTQTLPPAPRFVFLTEAGTIVLNLSNVRTRRISVLQEIWKRCSS
jgi:hypothetical protein